MTLTANSAFRRKVFYIPGYDPIHPRRYRELYRKEGADQARITGYDLRLMPRRGGGPYGWRVETDMCRKTVAEVEVLVWSDIVRASMATGIPATYLQLIRTAWAYIGSGALFRLMRLRKGPMIAALYPIGLLLVQLALALLVGFGLYRLGSLFHPALGILAGLAVIRLILRGFRRHDNRLFAYYLMHDYAYSAQSKGANPPELEARMAAFAARIRAALAECDEVLIVGHSSGAHLAVSILADLIRAGLPGGGPALSLLTLGQVVPMVSFLPGARRLRADLAYLSARPELTWVDVTAPGDGCAFALCDPVAVTGVAPPDKRWPLVVSAAFTQTLSPERWKELRWRFFRLHFQYLCAFDRPGDYDYFQITAGPLTLAERYQNRAPSKSRIETPLSPWRST
ncbi:hypothetical protein GC209_11080 [bacterium]|nr:hypothetical protein [bacterium]